MSARTRFVTACIAMAAMATTASAQLLTVPEADVEAGYASTHVLIRVRPGVETAALDDGRLTLAAPRRGARAARPSGAVAGTMQQFAAGHLRRAVRAGNAELAASIGLDRYVRVEVPAGTDTASFVERLARHVDLIEHAEVDGIGGLAVVPDDTWFPIYQYALNNTGQNIDGANGLPGADISAIEAWNLTTGSADTVVGILDAGVNNHEDLAGRLLPGYNVPQQNTDTGDVCLSHGTHVAGIACANGANAMGIAGVNWHAMVLPVTVVPSCNGSEADLATGIIWAVDNGADVINMSLQYCAATQMLHDAVTYAWQSGVILVAAAGNNGYCSSPETSVAYPARWPEVIAVAATDNRDLRPSFSNFGPEIDVAAPGQDIWSSTMLTNYQLKFGTSMATPHVSGLVSLMLAIDPTLTNEEVRTLLRSTADDVQAPGFDDFSGYGRINAGTALLHTTIFMDAPGDFDGDGDADVDDLIGVVVSFGPCPVQTPCDGDLDGNGQVDVDDLITVIINWS